MDCYREERIHRNHDAAEAAYPAPRMEARHTPPGEKKGCLTAVTQFLYNTCVTV